MHSLFLRAPLIYHQARPDEPCLALRPSSHTCFLSSLISLKKGKSVFLPPISPLHSHVHPLCSTAPEFPVDGNVFDQAPARACVPPVRPPTVRASAAVSPIGLTCFSSRIIVALDAFHSFHSLSCIFSTTLGSFKKIY